MSSLATLAFDKVVRSSDSGPESMSAEAFLALPLDVRVRYVLDRSLVFFLGSTAVNRRIALASLRGR